MAKLIKRFITIETRDYIWEDYAGTWGPLLIPFKVWCKNILPLIKTNKYDIYGFTRTGRKIRLNELNYDNDDDDPSVPPVPPPPPSGGSSGDDLGGEPIIEPGNMKPWNGKLGRGTVRSNGGRPVPDSPPHDTLTIQFMSPGMRKSMYGGKPGFDSNGDLIRDPGEDNAAYNERALHAGDIVNGYLLDGHPDPLFDPSEPKVYNDFNKHYVQMTADERRIYRANKPGFDENGIMIQHEHEADGLWYKRSQISTTYQAGTNLMYGYDGYPLDALYVFPRVGESLEGLTGGRKPYIKLEQELGTNPHALDQFKGKPGFDSDGKMVKKPGESDTLFQMRKERAGTFGYNYSCKRITEKITYFPKP